MSTNRKMKIFNDPVYGFINFRHAFLYELIDHPYVQRLRRIKQLGLTDFVYSGASHSRFNHCLGALHLMDQAIESLKWKGIEISDEESEAACIAILLHDVGHGPFSHALEKMILKVSHEEISIRVMEILNREYEGKLDLAIQIYQGKYHKKFLNELIAGQLDVDRMDYLNRDSFYTGVVEGMIGYDRIIKMLHVVDGSLVVEEKGKLSVEQFLMARRMMYWQVYLHKTVLSVEKMLLSLFQYIRDFPSKKLLELMPENLQYFFQAKQNESAEIFHTDEDILKFLELDDTEILMFLKSLVKKGCATSKLLAKGIINRHVFKVIIKNNGFSRGFVNEIRHTVEKKMGNEIKVDYLVLELSESNANYVKGEKEIRILKKDGKLIDLEEDKDLSIQAKKTEMFYLIYPG